MPIVRYGVAQSGVAPIALDGLAQTQVLYRIEKGLRGLSGAQRHAERQECSKTIFEEYEVWLAHADSFPQAYLTKKQ